VSGQLYPALAMTYEKEGPGWTCRREVRRPARSEGYEETLYRSKPTVYRTSIPVITGTKSRAEPGRISYLRASDLWS
jgi:hypothetical protein